MRHKEKKEAMRIASTSFFFLVLLFFLTLHLTSILSLGSTVAASSTNDFFSTVVRSARINGDGEEPAPPCPPCPPCFDCLNPRFKCENYSKCNNITKRCDECPTGWGNDNCGSPMCGSLVSKERKPVKKGEQCQCDDGWTGFNCNVCLTDGHCDPIASPANGTCYKGDIIVRNHFKQCQVHLPPLIDRALGGRKTYITMNCKRRLSTPPTGSGIEPKVETTCQLQFYLVYDPAFTCFLSECERQPLRSVGEGLVETLYECQKVKCDCFLDSELCDPDRLIDLKEIFDYVKGPGFYSCINGQNCTVSEKELDFYFPDGLVSTCVTGECISQFDRPGDDLQLKQTNLVLIVALSSSAALLLAFLLFGLFYMRKRKNKWRAGQYAAISDDELRRQLAHSHSPCTLVFANISYVVGERQVLDTVSGVIGPGQVMAIIGGSGSGKTSCLDIISRKRKTGIAAGNVYVNGVKMDGNAMRAISGYVDQEDTLLGTLTVRETLTMSAMLRLPASMPNEVKKWRVEQTMEELRLAHIADRFVGLPGKRGISGGEKRRVSIAQELVTSPSILFLDEPTSGLDAYNAYQVVDVLVTLARKYGRTVVFTIHQPRSNIFALFDQLLVLANGKMVYSGRANEVTHHLASIEYPCPEGFNVADFLIDLTLQASDDFVFGRSRAATIHENTVDNEDNEDDKSFLQNTPQAPLLGDETNLDSSNSSSIGDGESTQVMAQLENRAAFLASRFIKSPAGLLLLNTVSTVMQPPTAQLGQSSSSVQLPPTATNQDKDRISLFRQFLILSNRTAINLYRNPLLLLAHYVLSMAVAVLVGFMYWQITDSMAGIQNRLGSLFFACSFFAFSGMTALEFFAKERLLFIRERGNGFYSPFPYYLAKILFDVVPLRIVPPILFGSVCYFMVGYYPLITVFLKYILTLVLFNVSCTSIFLVIATICESSGMANLAATFTILFSMLFGGFLMNKEQIPIYLSWLKYLSMFFYAYECLIVNELVNVTLTEGGLVTVQIPGIIILRQFGFDDASFWRNIIMLGVITCGMLVIAFVGIKYLVKERR